MVIDDGAKKYVHELIDDAYKRQEIIDKMIIKGHSREFAEEALLQVMNDIVRKHENPQESTFDRMVRIKQVDEKGFYLYPDEPENK